MIRTFEPIHSKLLAIKRLKLLDSVFFKAIFFRNLKQILAKQTANLGHEFSGAMQDLLHFSLDSRNFE